MRTMRNNVLKLTMLSIFAFFTINVNAQVKIGTNPTTIDDGSVLELEGTNKALRLTRVALTGANDITTVPTPVTGQMVFNTATAGTAPNDVVANNVYIWDGTSWSRLNKQISSTGTSATSWSVGDERAFEIVAPMTAWDLAGTTKTLMASGAVNSTTTINTRLLSEAQGSTDGCLVINGLRLDFLRSNARPVFVNTTNTPITYSLVTFSTGNIYTTGVKHTIAPSAISYAIDGDNNFDIQNNVKNEMVHGYIVFTTGEWYAFAFYLVYIDGEVQGYTTARRIR